MWDKLTLHNLAKKCTQFLIYQLKLLDISLFKIFWVFCLWLITMKKKKVYINMLCTNITMLRFSAWKHGILISLQLCIIRVFIFSTILFQKKYIHIYIYTHKVMFYSHEFFYTGSKFQHCMKDEIYFFLNSWYLN